MQTDLPPDLHAAVVVMVKAVGDFTCPDEDCDHVVCGCKAIVECATRALVNAGWTVKAPADRASNPRFGDPITNPWASDDNPAKHGLFVREFRRAGRLNPGTIWEVTDGNGKFWEINGRDILRDVPERETDR